MPVKPIPDGYHTVTPCLYVEGASQLIEFLKKAFDAQETERVERPDGAIGHAEVKIGDSIVMLGDAGGEMEPMPTAIYLYVNDVDATYHKALQAGGTPLTEPANQFYGDRNGGVKDPAGNTWWIATHVEDVPREELERRVEAFMKQQSQG
jgi:uncharacterized glyoxalase superfamily protein PhnB